MILEEKVLKPARASEPIESISFGIQQENLSHIFGLLRKGLYSDPILACVREYTCNAIDSNIEAGKSSSEVEIVLPSELDSNFVVRDFGVGIDEEDIKIFSMYGSSTKRNSNDFVGCLGIGSKSAFSYTDVFTIETVKNGIERIYISTILDRNGNNDVGHIDKVAERETDKENGVTIKIPVREKDFGVFKSKTIDFLTYFKPEDRPKLIGADIEWPINKSIFSGRNWELKKCNFYSEGWSTVVMGNVAYKMSHKEISSIRSQSGESIVKEDIADILNSGQWVFRVPIGNLDISSNREEIVYNKKSADIIHNLLIQVKIEIQKIIENEVSKFSTKWEKSVCLKKYYNKVNKIYDILEIDKKYEADKINYIKMPHTRSLSKGIEDNEIFYEASFFESKYICYDDRLLKNSASTIYVSEDLLFVFTDYKKYYINKKIKQIYKKNREKKVVLVDIDISGREAFIKWAKEIGFDSCILGGLEDIELPKSEKKTKTAGKRRYFKQFCGSTLIDCDPPENKEIFYIDLSYGEPVYEGKELPYNSLCYLLDGVAKDFPELFKNKETEVYGIKKSCPKKILKEYKTINIVDYCKDFIVDFVENNEFKDRIQVGDKFEINYPYNNVFTKNTLRDFISEINKKKKGTDWKKIGKIISVNKDFEEFKSEKYDFILAYRDLVRSKILDVKINNELSDISYLIEDNLNKFPLIKHMYGRSFDMEDLVEYVIFKMEKKNDE